MGRQLLPAPLGRLLDRLGAPHRYLRLSLLALAFLWAIIPSGAAVRLTASGLGCPEWPLTCESGQVLPALSSHALIEYSNRVFSALVMLVAVLAWVVAMRIPSRPRQIRRFAGAAALSTIGQIPLGGITVAFHLHPLLVASHFLLSIFALSFGTMALLNAHDRSRDVRRGHDVPGGRLAAVTALGLLIAIVTGALVTGAGPHSGDRAESRRLWNVTDAAYVHVRAVAAFAVLALILTALLARDARRPFSRPLLVGWICLIAGQIALGEWQYRHQFPWEVILVHVSTAGALWMVTVALVRAVARPPIAERERLSAAVSDRLARHTPLGVRSDS